MAVRQERAWGAYVDPPLKGKVAVVTGAAKGLGGAITDVLACDGAQIVLAGRDLEALEAHGAALDAEYPESDYLVARCDVTSEADVTALIRAAVERFGGLDILVNTAGVIGPIETPAQDVSVDDFRAVLDVNLVGTFLPCKAAIPHLIERGGGRIVNIAGTSGLRGYRNRVSYSSSKWAVRGLTRTLALELGPHNITVNAICPNVTHGERMTRIVNEKARRLGRAPDDVYADFTAQTALGRFIEDSDVAHAVRYLVSAGARNVTGHDIVVDAGWDV
jgi:NAD(P)-dependent dehydrogenase (short-subunit alcohol dehydrogenase family)